MKLKLIFLRVLTIIVLVITIIEIKQTYAVFYSELHGTSESNIGKWNIEVNSTNISSGINSDFTIANLIIDSNPNVKEGKLSPGTTGEFDIFINPKDTKVSIRYDITIDETNINNNSIALSSIDEVSDNEVALVKTSANTYTGIIPLRKINGTYSNDIKIKFDWINNEENNINDSLIGIIKNNKLNIPINVSITQYLNESIVEYISE